MSNGKRYGSENGGVEKNGKPGKGWRTIEKSRSKAKRVMLGGGGLTKEGGKVQNLNFKRR